MSLLTTIWSGFQYNNPKWKDTIGIDIVKSSDCFKWSGLNAIVTAENPHRTFQPAMETLWIAMALSNTDVIVKSDNKNEGGIQLPFEITIIPPNREVEVTVGSKSSVMHSYIDPNILQEVAGELFDVPLDNLEIIPAFCAEDKILTMLLEVARVTLDEGNNRDALKIDYLSRAISAQVLSQYSTLRAVKNGWLNDGGLSRRQLTLATDYIEAHLNADVHIADLASVVCLGRSAFIRRFKISTGLPPHQYIMKVRVGRAQNLLRRSEMDLAHIALACGFADQAHLTSTFKRFTGLTPLSYRRQAA